jgi:hypothetical protein
MPKRVKTGFKANKEREIMKILKCELNEKVAELLPTTRSAVGT